MKRQPFLSVQKLHSLLGINPASTEVPTLANVDMPIYRTLILANAGIPIHVSVEVPHRYLCEAPSLPYRLTISFFKVIIPISVPGDIPSPTTAGAFVLRDVQAPPAVSSIPVDIEVTSC